MDSILEKLTHYELLVSIIPGFIFFLVINALHKLPDYLLMSDALDKLLLYYVLGLFIGRVGSLIVEPVCRRSGIIKFSPYKDFLVAAETDKRIVQFSEINNLYRNIIAMTIIIFSFIYSEVTLCGFVLFLFILSFELFVYRKQTEYTRANIERILRLN